jgi:V/A-type H+-transporting ATPase subunit I
LPNGEASGDSVIETMKKVTIACLASERQATVTAMQRLGTVHVTPLVAPSSDELDSLLREQENLSRVLNTFKNMKVEADDVETDPAASLAEVQEILTTRKQLEEELALATRACAQLEPWGNFDQETLTNLEQRGIYVALCTSAPGRFPELPENAAIAVVSKTKSAVHYAVVSTTPLDDVVLPRATLPAQTDLSKWQETAGKLRRELQERQERLSTLAEHSMQSLEKYAVKLEEDIAFAKARDGMEAKNAIAFLGGYVPEKHLDELREAARENGWAIRYEDIPEDDENVPTSLIIPPRFAMAKVIFDFIGILPGYHEIDVSVSVLIFLSIFCGMLVGDAGYGLLFTCILLYLKKRLGDSDPAKRQVLNLGLSMSLCILGYGWLSGNWLALPAEKLPRILRGLPWLTDSEYGETNVKLLCFFIGAFHMSMARAWRTCIAGNLRDALGHVGWGLFLWGNFFLAKTLVVDGGGFGDLNIFAKCLYVVGFFTILIFGVDWKDMGAVIYLPFSFINSFVDVLSYIRLFAVGLSSLYIAQSFNQMAGQLYSLSPWMIPLMLLLLACGHALNIALAAMGVLVHGIRLNTLEFSGHMDLSWSGKPYRPLRKTEV